MTYRKRPRYWPIDLSLFKQLSIFSYTAKTRSSKGLLFRFVFRFVLGNSLKTRYVMLMGKKYGKRSIRRDLNNIKQCRFCGVKFQKGEVLIHEGNCKHRLLSCLNCMKKVPWNEIRKHTRLCRKNKNKKQLKKKKEIIHTSSKVEQRKAKFVKSRHRLLTCLYCMKKFRSDYFPKHSSICKEYKKVKGCPNRRCMFCIYKKNSGEFIYLFFIFYI